MPYCRKDHEGKHVPTYKQADYVAQYFHDKIWNKSTTGEEDLDTAHIHHNPMDWNIDPFTLAELEEVLRKMKTNKAPGPDGIPAEAFKNLKGDNKLQLLAVINKWFDSANNSLCFLLY